VEQVTQVYAVTFNHQAVVGKLRREVAWPLAAGGLVFGWLVTVALQRVRVIAVPGFAVSGAG
jgi:hypothetical protein